jgi:hypothetical protein
MIWANAKPRLHMATYLQSWPERCERKVGLGPHNQDRTTKIRSQDAPRIGHFLCQEAGAMFRPTP